MDKDISGNDSKIRSALDIALEKAQKLGDLSVEERQRMKEEELAQIADTLARRYFNGLPLREIEKELDRHSGEERQIVARYLLSHLLLEINFEHTERDEKTLAAIEHLYGDSTVVQSTRDLLHEYQAATDTAWRENYTSLATAQLTKLKLKGIAGSAVEPAIETSPAWLEIVERLNSSYQERLARIRQEYSNL